MHAFRRFIGLGACLAVTAISYAGDGDSDYRVHDGERIPTRVMEPSRASRVARPQAAERAAARQDVDQTPRDDMAGRSNDTDEQRRGELQDRLPRFRGSFEYYRRGLDDRSPYYGSYGYRYGFLPYGYDYGYQDAYEAGRNDEISDERKIFNQNDMDMRAHKLLKAHDRALDLGLEQLHRADYAAAVTSLTLAARLDNGDPACRIHLAQAELARGHYDEAAAALRRAIELQPNSVYLPLNLEQYYARPDLLTEHTDALEEYVRENSASAYVHFLLGFMQREIGRTNAAFASFLRVAAVLPKDEHTQNLLKLVQPERRPATIHRAATAAKAR